MEWFLFDGVLGEAEQVFLAALRARAQGWDEDPRGSFVARLGGGGPLAVAVDLVAPDERAVLVTVGVHFADGGVRGDEVHNQSFTLPDEPTELAFAAAGGPAEVAELAATWFEETFRRPIERHEWVHKGQVYAAQWSFADTGRGLSGMFNRELCPPGDHLAFETPADVVALVRGRPS